MSAVSQVFPPLSPSGDSAAQATLIARVRSLHANLVTLAACLRPFFGSVLTDMDRSEDAGTNILSAANRAGRSPPKPGNARSCAALTAPRFQKVELPALLDSSDLRAAFRGKLVEERIFAPSLFHPLFHLAFSETAGRAALSSGHRHRPPQPRQLLSARNRKSSCRSGGYGHLLRRLLGGAVC